MSHIFISYNHTDQEAVKALVKDLKELDHNVWYDQALTGGQSWWDKILSTLRESDLFIFALSSSSLGSDACKRELDYVQKLGKTILPVLLSDDVNLNLLPRALSKIQVMDYRDQDKKAAFALVKAMSTLPPSKPLPDPLPDPPAVPFSYLKSLKEEIELTDSLNFEQQLFLVSKIRASLEKQGCSRDEVLSLFYLMKKQDGLLAKIGKEIDDVLVTMNKTTQYSEEKESAPQNGDREGGSPGEAHPCKACGQTNLSGARFCASCGNALINQPEIHPAVPVPPKPSDPKGTKTRRFLCSTSECAQLVTDLEAWLEAQNYNCQRLSAEGEALVLQVAQKGSWRKFVGMATSLNIVFHQSENTLDLEVGAGKWIDKAAVGTVSLFVLWPLAVTAGIGAWQQMKLPEKIFDFIGNRLTSK